MCIDLEEEKNDDNEEVINEEKNQIKDSAKEQYKSVTNLYLPRNDKNCICTSVPNVNTQEAKPGR